MTPETVYEERVSSDRTEALFVGLTLLFLAFLGMRATGSGFGYLAAVFLLLNDRRFHPRPRLPKWDREPATPLNPAIEHEVVRLVWIRDPETPSRPRRHRPAFGRGDTTPLAW